MVDVAIKAHMFPVWSGVVGRVIAYPMSLALPFFIMAACAPTVRGRDFGILAGWRIVGIFAAVLFGLSLLFLVVFIKVSKMKLTPAWSAS